LLAFFKYSGGLVNSLGALLVHLNLPFPPTTDSLLLPIGISFYTFQGISYIVEIYRQKIKPVAFPDLALYLAFFPKLIAGPMISPTAFITWLNNPSAKLEPANREEALKLIFSGLIKKIIIADNLASLADVAFRAAALPNGASLPPMLFWQGFYLYTIQIYADFSGYTDLARGSALLLGLRMPPNFRQPYLAATITDFWNRWHMSLTQWFREYLFFPLSRWLLTLSKRRWSQLVQISVNLIVMLLIGWWHGAALTFIAWGIWHGILLSLERLLGWKPRGRVQTVLSTVLTFHLVGVGWVLFRASSFTVAARFFTGMFNFQNFQWLPGYLLPLLLALGAAFFIDCVETRLVRIPKPFTPVIVVAILVLLAGLAVLGVVRGGDARPFIYGQF
jgi:alginate O-acetyltransferase complex protein AlgI